MKLEKYGECPLIVPNRFDILNYQFTRQLPQSIGINSLDSVIAHVLS
jgi:hypothetical protein